MPPSEKVSRSDIVRAAIEVVESDAVPPRSAGAAPPPQGLAALTARRVAGQLGVSTAPVYRNFESMDELARAVMEHARDQLLDYTSRVYSDRPFLDMGTGIAVFAREHPRLYHALFLESDRFGELVRGILARLTDDMRKDARFADLDQARRATLLDRMWTYTHGLASLITVGLAEDPSNEGIIASLEAVGGAVIRGVLASSAP